MLFHIISNYLSVYWHRGRYSPDYMQAKAVSQSVPFRNRLWRKGITYMNLHMQPRRETEPLQRHCNKSITYLQRGLMNHWILPKTVRNVSSCCGAPIMFAIEKCIFSARCWLALSKCLFWNKITCQAVVKDWLFCEPFHPCKQHIGAHSKHKWKYATCGHRQWRLQTYLSSFVLLGRTAH